MDFVNYFPAGGSLTVQLPSTPSVQPISLSDKAFVIDFDLPVSLSSQPVAFPDDYLEKFLSQGPVQDDSGPDGGPAETGFIDDLGKIFDKGGDLIDKVKKPMKIEHEFSFFSFLPIILAGFLIFMYVKKDN